MKEVQSLIFVVVFNSNFYFFSHFFFIGRHIYIAKGIYLKIFKQKKKKKKREEGRILCITMHVTQFTSLLHMLTRGIATSQKKVNMFIK